MSKPAKPHREPLAPSPSETAGQTDIIALIDRLLAVSEEMERLCREGAEPHAQTLNQLMLERGMLLDQAHTLPMDSERTEIRAQDFQDKLARLAELDQLLGETLQHTMRQIQAQLGTCKNSRQLISHYRVSGRDERHTRSSQA